MLEPGLGSGVCSAGCVPRGVFRGDMPVGCTVVIKSMFDFKSSGKRCI